MDTLLALAIFTHRVISIYCPIFRCNKRTLTNIKYKLWSDLRVSMVAMVREEKRPLCWEVIDFRSYRVPASFSLAGETR